MKRPISTRLHGALDYLTGGLLAAAPSVLGLERDAPAARSMRAAAAGHAGYSLVTDYELGAVKALPMRAHLALDAAGAVALAASPWLLGTARRGRRHWLPQLGFGLYELGAVALSDPDRTSGGRSGLSGAVVVITGASSGIGRATAERFADDGAKLVLAARRAQPLADTAAACEERGAEAIAVPTDVRDEQAVARLAQAAVERFGRIDVWVNNAGVTLMGRLDESPPELWRGVVETNLFGAVNGSREAVRRFRRQGSGTIVNVASVNARAASPYATSYVASKFALRGFSESLRQELRGDGIDVVTVLPASIDSPFFQHVANYMPKQVKPLRPILKPERVADAIVRAATRPRREVIVGASGRQLVLMHDLAGGVFERMMRRQVERDHFREAPATPTSGSVTTPMEEGTGVTGGWKEGEGDAPGPERAHTRPRGLTKIR
jgi:short-subunit dehydrogenase